MIRYFVHRDGRTTPASAIRSGVAAAPTQRRWSGPTSPSPTADDGQVLRELFGIHELAVDDALEETPHPKVEAYGDVLYVVLHGINFQASEHAFDTHDTDFFLARASSSRCTTASAAASPT